MSYNPFSTDEEEVTADAPPSGGTRGGSYAEQEEEEAGELSQQQVAVLLRRYQKVKQRNQLLKQAYRAKVRRGRGWEACATFFLTSLLSPLAAGGAGGGRGQVPG